MHGGRYLDHCERPLGKNEAAIYVKNEVVNECGKRYGRFPSDRELAAAE
jgi:hypothetical protein